MKTKSMFITFMLSAAIAIGQNQNSIIASQLSPYVIVTTEKAKLEGCTFYSGGIGVKKAATGKAEIKSGTNITAPGTFVTASQIVKDNTSQVSSQTISPAYAPLPPFQPMNFTGTLTVNIPANATVTLTDTLYKEVKIGKNATAIFTAAKVSIERALQVSDGANVRFTQCSKMLLKAGMSAGKNITINPDSMAVVLYINSDLTFNEGSRVWGTFYLGNTASSDTAARKLLINASLISKPGIYKGLFICKELDARANNRFYLNAHANNCVMPAIQCPSDQARNTQSSQCGYTVAGTEFDMTSTTPVQYIASRTNSMNSQSTLTGAAFNTGTTQLQWTLTDVNGNTAQCSFSVSITDNEPPVFLCPADIIIAWEDSAFQFNNINYDPPTDNCGIQSLTHNMPAIFLVGITTVTWTVADVNGNLVNCV